MPPSDAAASRVSSPPPSRLVRSTAAGPSDAKAMCRIEELWKVNLRYHSNSRLKKTETATTPRIQAKNHGVQQSLTSSPVCSRPPRWAPVYFLLPSVFSQLVPFLLPPRCRCSPTGGTGGRCSGSKRSSLLPAA